MTEMIEDIINKDITEESKAACLSPMVLVDRPGDKRLCLDYQKVNSQSCTDIHPLHRLQELIETASRNEFYITLDL